MNDLTLLSSGDITLRNQVVLNNVDSGNIILQAGGNFHNDSGTLAPVETAGGRTLIYSTRPDQNRNDIEMTNIDFRLFGKTFDPLAPLDTGSLTGDGLNHEVSPTVTASAADQTITYGTASPITTSLAFAATVRRGCRSTWLSSESKHQSTAALKNGLGGIRDAGTYLECLQISSTLSGTNSTAISGVTFNRENGSLVVNRLGVNITGVTGSGQGLRCHNNRRPLWRKYQHRDRLG